MLPVYVLVEQMKVFRFSTMPNIGRWNGIHSFIQCKIAVESAM